MNKPELLVTARDPEEAKRLILSGADAVQIGHEKFALRLPDSHSLTDIQKTVLFAKQRKAKVYLTVNALFHQGDLEDLTAYIKEARKLEIDALIFGDPAVYSIAKSVAPNLPLFWNTETTTTNYQMINFWAKKGIKQAIVARELNLEQVLEIKEKTKAEIQVQIHGTTCIFHSKRELVTSYKNFYNITTDRKNQNASRALYYLHEQGKKENYPTFEDHHGTHVFSNEDLCMIEHLKPLVQNNIDSLKIDGLFKSTEALEKIVGIYRKAIDQIVIDPEISIQSDWLRALQDLQEKNRPLGTGFYYKELIY